MARPLEMQRSMSATQGVDSNGVSPPSGMPSWESVSATLFSAQREFWPSYWGARRVRAGSCASGV